MLKRLKQQIKNGDIAEVYVFYGEERLLINQMIDQIRKKILPEGLEDFNLEVIAGDKVNARQIADLANTLPFMAEKRVLIVDGPVMLQSNMKGEGDDDALLAYLDDPNPQCCLILKCGDKIDKRKKLFKKLQEKGTVVAFEHLKGKELEQWIIRYLAGAGKNIDKQALAYLTAMNSYTLEILTNELDKVIVYSGEQDTITLTMAEEMITKTVEGNVFNLIDAIGQKQGKKAIGLLQDILYLGEAPLKIVALLVRHFRLLVMMKDLRSQGYGEKEIKDQLKLHPFVVTKGLAQGAKFTMDQLVGCLEALLLAEVEMKSSSTPAAEVIEKVVINLCYLQ